MKRRVWFVLVSSLLAALSLGCSKDKKSTSEGEGAEVSKADLKEGPVTLNGAGATFPYPLYSKWVSEFGKVNPNVRINYQSIGSGGGIRQVTAGTVDFGASDAPMKDEEAKKAPSTLLHIPTTLGAVAITYNVEGVDKLKLDADAVSAIFLGKIAKWNDPKIAALNEGVTLPDADVMPVFRSDGSGTTAVFTDYLAKVNSEFKDTVGVGKSVKWPKGLGAKGNEGVTGQIKTTPGAVGYVELAYATQNKLAVAALKNQAGEFVEPSIDAISKAAAGSELPESLTLSITNSEGPGAYPIAAFTYLLVYENMKDFSKGAALAKFLWWAAHDGQKHAAPLHYAPLPESVIKKVEARIKSLKSGDKVLYSGE